MRLDKLLTSDGKRSRSEARDLIRHGGVTVDGISVTDPSSKVDPKINVIGIAGGEYEYNKYAYIMMNKPAGLLSATADARSLTVFDVLPAYMKKLKLSPAGRLDRDTEGFLLLSNDGEFIHRVISPTSGVEKRYFARVSGELREYMVDEFETGLEIDGGYECLPAKLRILSSGEEFSEAEVTVCEGKFHQVKRMFEAVGCKVVYLKRLSIGGVELDETLENGMYRELTTVEIETIRSSFHRRGGIKVEILEEE